MSATISNLPFAGTDEKDQNTQVYLAIFDVDCMDGNGNRWWIRFTVHFPSHEAFQRSRRQRFLDIDPDLDAYLALDEEQRKWQYARARGVPTGLEVAMASITAMMDGSSRLRRNEHGPISEVRTSSNAPLRLIGQVCSVVTAEDLGAAPDWWDAGESSDEDEEEEDNCNSSSECVG